LFPPWTPCSFFSHAAGQISFVSVAASAGPRPQCMNSQQLGFVVLIKDVPLFVQGDK